MGGIGLGIILALLVALLMVATGRWRADAFLVLISCAFIFGLASGAGIEKTLETIKTGFGNTLGSIGIVIILGAMIGVFLEKTGASGAIAKAMLRLVGEKRTGLSLSLTGYIVSIPVFCDSGFIVLVPLVRELARRANLGRLTLAVCLATGLYSTHCLVPPTPGPLAAAQALGADLGLVIAVGLIAAIFPALVGYFWAMRFASERLPDEVAGRVAEEKAENREQEVQKAPGALLSLLPILTPIILITLGSVAGLKSAPFGKALAFSLIKGAGHPVFALGLGLALSFTFARRGSPRGSWLAEAIKSCAMVLAVTAAGGAFGQVIRASELSGTLQSTLGAWKAGVLVPFVLAAALKSAQGSSTVSMITTAAIIQPLLGTLGLGAAGWGPTVAVVAVASGAMVVSHANDSYFWVISQMANIPVNVSFRVYTTATALMGITGAIVSLALSIILLP